jgi:predicted Zn-dependent peptidase
MIYKFSYQLSVISYQLPIDAIAKVTPADIQRVAKTYLDPTKQTIGYFEPTQPDGQPGTSSMGTGFSNTNPHFI